nr:hypothetical protein [Planomicrobium sp. CPCC 101079]
MEHKEPTRILDFAVANCLAPQKGQIIPLFILRVFLNVVFQLHWWPQFWQVGIETPPM